MRTYKLTVAYDGTNYQGWQRQTSTDRTIQGILENILSEKIGMFTEVDGSGRTDAGVHAKGQVVSVVLPGKVEESFFLSDVNKSLPDDIRILKSELVKNGFHARKSAIGKRYEYYIDTGEKADVFSRRYSYHFPRELDVSVMRMAASYLRGEHDFSGYTDKKDDTSKKRTIYGIEIQEISDGIDEGGKSRGRVVITYNGTGFLYHMVRILTGTLLEVGVHERSVESVKDALESGARSQAGFLAPAQGLFLKEVYYE